MNNRVFVSLPSLSQFCLHILSTASSSPQYLLCHCSLLTKIEFGVNSIFGGTITLACPVLHSNMWMNASFFVPRKPIFCFQFVLCLYISKVVYYLCVNFHFKRVFNFIVNISLPESVHTQKTGGKKEGKKNNREKNKQSSVRRYLFIPLIYFTFYSMICVFSPTLYVLKKMMIFVVSNNVRLHNLLFAVAIDLIVHHIRDILLPNGLLRNNINQLENHSHSSDDEALFNTHH